MIFDKQNEYLDQHFEALELPNQAITSKVFENCTFVRCDLSEVDFKKSKFVDCTFEHCNLSVIKINGCMFNMVNFQNSKVIGVNWTEAAWPTIKLACPLNFIECDISHSTFFGGSIWVLGSYVSKSLSSDSISFFPLFRTL